jgi:hypothetical protein
VTLATNYLRATVGRTTVLCAGLSAAAVVFAVLAVTAPAPIVLLGDRLPAGSPRPGYDLLVGAAGHAAWTTDAAAASGGISLAQYGVVRRLPGVAVAAPMTMMGYVPVKVTFPVAVPTAAVTSPPKVLAVTAMYRRYGNPGAVSGRNADRAYVTAYPLLLNSGRNVQVASAVAPPAAVIRAPACPGAPSRPRQPMVYVAVDRPTPCWSARATPGPHARGGAPQSAVSVLLGWTFLLPLVAVDPAAEARLLHLDKAVVRGRYLPATAPAPLASVPMIVASSLADKDEAQLNVTTFPAGRTIGTATVTAATAYSLLVGHVRAAALAVPAYWTTSAVGGPLIRHGARPSGAGRASLSGASLQAIGVFNPDMVAGSLGAESPYHAARTITQTAAPAGYPGLATLVMPLQEASAFTATGAYAGLRRSMPIGSIRVVVAGVTGHDPLSFARLRAVAQEIVRATGLHVDVTVAAAATVAVGLDPGRLELAILVLLLGLTFFINGVGATLQGRRRDLLTLRALGWRRGRLMRQLLLEFALVAAGGWILAVALASVSGAVSPARPTRWWPVLAAGAAAAVTLAAIWWPLRQATRESARRSPKRTALGVVVLALGCAAVGQELAAQRVFHGIIVGSVLGRAVVWQTDPADLVAAVTVLAVTTLAVADVHWLNIGKRALELRTLHAIGWPSRSVVRLVVLEAVLAGAMGGLAGCSLDLVGGLAVTHTVSAGMLLVAASVFALGVFISLVALGLAAIARARVGDLDAGRPREAADGTD